jgi:sugar phosphate isomerase/epimerase
VTVGDGDVDVYRCLALIRDAGYTGYVALEYEGEENELRGVPRSVAFMKEQLSRL